MIKKLIFFMLIPMVFFSPNALFSQEIKEMRVVCSLFPEYDFAKNIISDLGEVHLLLRPGVEVHDFEPSAKDVRFLNDSDVFIYTGDLMEPWAKKIISSLNNEVKIIDSSYYIESQNSDPHIWLDLSKAEVMLKNILNGLISADPKNSEVYKRNAEKYISRLQSIDKKFFELKENYGSKILIFGGHFSFGYLVNRYNFDYISAYDGENEPSVRQLARVIKFINENGNKYFLCDKFGVTKISQSIKEQTNAEILILDSIHNISAEEFKNNISFLDIMENNVNSLRKFLENI